LPQGFRQIPIHRAVTGIIADIKFLYSNQCSCK
jgi:hypothetical protein